MHRKGLEDCSYQRVCAALAANLPWVLVPEPEATEEGVGICSQLMSFGQFFQVLRIAAAQHDVLGH